MAVKRIEGILVNDGGLTRTTVDQLRADPDVTLLGLCCFAPLKLSLFWFWTVTFHTADDTDRKSDMRMS